MDKATQTTLAQQFHALHDGPELLILPNAWDAGSAIILERTGFRAIGTTSAGIAFTLGYPDHQQIPFESMLAGVRAILRRLNVPLTVDMEAGYDNPVETVHQIIEAGAVGLNFEDILPGADALLPIEEQCRRISELAALKTQTGIPFFINARTDVYLFTEGQHEKSAAAAVERANAYIDAGADGIFVPGQIDAADIRKLAQGIKAPFNLLAVPSNPPLADLQKMGVARLSIGSGAVRAVMGLAQHIAGELHQREVPDSLFRGAIPYDDMNRILAH